MLRRTRRHRNLFDCSQGLFAASLVELGQLESVDWLAKVDQYACLPRVITDKRC